jgi:hypothetical protein
VREKWREGEGKMWEREGGGRTDRERGSEEEEGGRLIAT